MRKTLYTTDYLPRLQPWSPAAFAAVAFAAVLTIPIVWRAFMPSHFEFNPLTAADYERFATFLLFSAVMICFPHLVREARALMGNRDR